MSIGTGFSTVAVVKDRVYTIGDEWLYCLNADSGEILWKKECGAAHSTPTVHDNKVYAYSKLGLLLCVDATNGEVLWRKDMREDLQADMPGAYGYAASPLIVDDLVIVPFRLESASSSPVRPVTAKGAYAMEPRKPNRKGTLAAFNRTTGKEVWRTPHELHGAYAFWSSPVLATLDGRRIIVWLPAHDVLGVNPTDGAVLWKYEYTEEDGFAKIKKGDTALTPAVWENRILGHHHPDHARFQNHPEVTFCLEIQGGKPRLLWKKTEKREVLGWFHSPVILDGLAYGGFEILNCYDMKTGEIKWSTQKLIADGKLHRPESGSEPYLLGGRRPRRAEDDKPPTIWVSEKLVVADGKLICWGDRLTVLEVSEKGYRVLAAAPVNGRNSWPVPVLANGRLYCRIHQEGRLICLDVRSNGAADGKQIPCRDNGVQRRSPRRGSLHARLCGERIPEDAADDTLAEVVGNEEVIPDDGHTGDATERDIGFRMLALRARAVTVAVGADVADDVSRHVEHLDLEAGGVGHKHAVVEVHRHIARAAAAVQPVDREHSRMHPQFIAVAPAPARTELDQ
jgi:outer membrane protein assembly factor BamB